MFTDVVSSTEQRVRVGDVRADELRRAHDAIVALAAAGHGGVVVKSTGDGALLAFGGSSDAIDAAVTIQRSVHRRALESAEPFSVRIGVAAGDVTFDAGDLFGTPVVEAARVCGIASDGDVLVTEIVRALAGSHAAFELISHGEHELKGLGSPTRLWSVRYDAEDGGVDIRLPARLVLGTDFAFAGRGAELALLSSAWRVCCDGECRTVFLSGEPGIGKTRLAAELARLAVADDGIVLYGCCDEASSSPYQPVVEALDEYVAKAPSPILGSGGDQLARISIAVRESGTSPAAGSGDAETDQYLLFSAVVSWLDALAGTQPVLLVVDDLHWATQPTLLLLQHALKRARDVRLLFVLTYRDTDLDRAHPLAATLAELRRSVESQRLSLDGIDADATLQLIGQATDTSTVSDVDFATRLRQETSGNPLFIVETLRHLGETGARRGGIERDREGASKDALDLPEGVRQVIGRRLDRLGTPVSDLLQVAAVVGREFDLHIAIAASSLAEDEALDSIDHAMRARLVEDLGGDRYRFSHALVRAALVDEMSSARRLRTHRRVAEALEEVRPRDVVALALHWSEAAAAGTGVEQTVNYSLEAAAELRGQAAFDEAARVLERALDAVDSDSLDRDRHADILETLGDARMAGGHINEARDAYAEAAALLPDSSPQLARIALSFDGPARIETPDDRYRPLLERVLQTVDERSQRGLAARLHARLALNEDVWTPYQLQHAEIAVELAEQAGDDELARYDAYRSRFWTQRPEDVPWEHAAKALAAARTVDDPTAILEALGYCMIGEGLRGDFHAIEQLATEYKTRAEQSGLVTPRVFSHVLEARLAIAHADFDRAQQVARRMQAILDDESTAQAAGLIQLECLAMRDEHAAVAQVLQDLIRTDAVPRELTVTVSALLALRLAHARHTHAATQLLDELCSDNLRRVAREGDAARLAELALLADATSALRHRDHAEPLMEALVPWEHANAQFSMSLDLGPTTLYLGKLARLLDHLDLSENYLRRAIQQTTDNGATLKANEARIELAATLKQQHHTDDPAALLTEASRFATLHELAFMLRQIEAVQTDEL